MADQHGSAAQLIKTVDCTRRCHCERENGGWLKDRGSRTTPSWTQLRRIYKQMGTNIEPWPSKIVMQRLSVRSLHQGRCPAHIDLRINQRLSFQRIADQLGRSRSSISAFWHKRWRKLVPEKVLQEKQRSDVFSQKDIQLLMDL